MVGTLGAFQKRKFSGWSGITQKNHIYSALGMKSQRATDTMIKLMAFHNGTTLESVLAQFPTKEFDTNDDFYWDVIGSNRVNVPLVEVRDENGAVVTADRKSDLIGAHTSVFTIVVAGAPFADGQFIVGEKNEIYQLRILGDGIMEGSNTAYRVELAGGNMDGMPGAELLPGKRFSIDAAFVEDELSRSVDDLTFSTPVSVRNEWSTIRIKHKMAGSTMDVKFQIGLPIQKRSANGGYEVAIANTWSHVAEFELENTFSERKNNALMFGRSNRNKNGEYTNIGKSGNVIKTGDGVYAQMEKGNTAYYNNFSLKKLEDMLYDLCSIQNLPIDQRKIQLHTGMYGAKQFNKAVKLEVSGWNIQLNSQTFISQEKSELNKNALGAGHQYVKYYAPNGVEISLVVDPFYDDPYRNKIKHPNGGLAMSYRYDIFDMGTAEQPNIVKCKIRGEEEIRGLQPGLRNPFTGETNINYMGTDEDGATAHRMARLGVIVYDVTRTASLIPSILAE